MTKQQNKIKTLYLPKYCMELSKIYFFNGASIKILDYIQKTSMPCDLQKAILSGCYSDVLKLVRQYRMQVSKGHKTVKISYSCDVFASVTQTWHAVADTLACGCYDSIKDIKKAINQKRMANNEHILKGYIKNLKFAYKFNFVF